MTKVEQTGGIRLECGHDSFHLECVKAWVKTSGQCPCCRTEVSEKLRNIMGIETFEERFEDEYNENIGQEDVELEYFGFGGSFYGE